MLYHSKGEGWSERDSNRRKLLEKKVEGAKAAAEKLAENIIVVKDNLAAKRERKQRAAAAASDKRPATDGKDKSSPNKKAKTTTDDSNKKSPPATTAEAEGNKPNPAVDPQSVVGLRIGKYFQDNELYFGEIEGFYKANETDDRVDLWNVIYDDGDVEDFELGEVEQGLEIYAKHKDEDENAWKMNNGTNEKKQIIGIYIYISVVFWCDIFYIIIPKYYFLIMIRSLRLPCNTYFL